MSRADNSIKNWQNLPMTIPKQISTISMHISNLVKSVEICSIYCPESKIQMYWGQITLTKKDEICPLAIPKQMSIISSLMKIQWHLLKIKSKNENTDISQTDNSVKNWWNLPISNPKQDRHNINKHTEFGENPLKFTQVIALNENTDGRTTDGQTDGRTANVIP